MRVQRNDDMHPAGDAVLRLTVQADGDVIVALEAPDPITGKPAYATAEFCTPGQGGGRSPRTHAALRNLADAMRVDDGGEESKRDADLREAAAIGARWMRWWLSQHERNCEAGHTCGREERERELRRVEAALERPNVIFGFNFEM